MSTWLALGAGVLALELAGALAGAETLPTKAGDVTFTPVNHATLVIAWAGKTVYVDPVGNAQWYESFAKPDAVLVTHIHGDHYQEGVLREVVAAGTRLIVPPALAEALPKELKDRATPLANGKDTALFGAMLTAVPMYNLTAARLKFHPKGQGNGYVLELGGKRIYLSGDTEDTPEMRALKSIDVAFLCMNLPYTMSVEQAADAVRAFKPKVVYPYHSRGSDTARFQKLVGEDVGVEVRLRNWYP